jgi:hypothetical protein
MTDNYANWRLRIEGKEVKTFLQPQLFDCGYYRKPLVKKLANGQNETTGWEPVAIFISDDGLAGLIGSGDAIRDLTEEEIYGEQLWSWINNRPITYEVYQAVAERGEPWPDSKEVQLAATMGVEAIPAANREVNRSDNAPPDEVDNRPGYVIAAEAIDKAIAVSKAHVVKDLASAEIGLGIVNRIAELRLKAKRDGEAEYKPLYAQYKNLLDAWKPPVDRADTEEKRQTANINGWKRAEEKRLKDEAAKAEAERARIAAEAEKARIAREEAEQRIADRAIANGEPPSMAEAPFEVEMPEPEPVKPAPVQPTTVALVGTYGRRKLRETPVEPTFTIDDYDAVYNHFKNLESVKSCLAILVKAAVKSNITVPGVTVTKPEE